MRYLCLILLYIYTLQALAQDTEPVETVITDTGIIIEKVDGYDTLFSKANKFDPQRALMLSAALPGLGQVYNKKYWKVPLVYGGIGFMAYQLNFYQNGFITYKNYLFAEVDQNPRTINDSGFSESQLRTIVERYRRQRDLYIVYSGIFYLIQIVDAHVDAHLKEFDVNPKLQVKIEPSFEQNLYFSSAGISLKLKF
ncbi:MAG TPA: DUF5683 domain-containing protein [Cyclobacteriaceae bacterium]|nr:DUF5683 domain-containing protein [Cyclobacteriaceae bacterium]